MQVPIKRNKSIGIKPMSVAQEGDDEPPDPSPCVGLAPHPSTLKPCGRIVRFPAHRAGILNPAVRTFRKKHFPNVPTKLWNDWQWQTRNRIRTLGQLKSMIVLSDEERAAFTFSETTLPLGITPYYMSLVAVDDPPISPFGAV